MSSLARRMLVVAMLAGSAAFGGQGCADSESMIFIRQVNVPVPGGATGCTVTADPAALTMPQGSLDVAFRLHYDAALLVGNQLVNRGSREQLRTETASVQIEGAEVRLEDASGARAWGPFTVPATGYIDPAVGSTPSFGLAEVVLLGPDFGAQMSAQLAGSPGLVKRYTSVVKVFGHTLGGTPVDTGEWHFPISICYGCLISYPSAANDPKLSPQPNCDLPVGTGTTLPETCTPGQDETVDCRICKAMMPTADICEPVH